MNEYIPARYFKIEQNCTELAINKLVYERGFDDGFQQAIMQLSKTDNFTAVEFLEKFRDPKYKFGGE